VSVAGSIALMAYTDALLLGITLAAVLVTFLLMGLILPLAKTAMLMAQQGVGQLLGVLDRSLRAIRTVKASRAEEREEQSVRDQATVAFRSGTKVAGVQAIVGPAMTLGVQGSMLLVLGIGGERVASGRMSIADLITFLLYLTTLAVPLANLMQFLNDLQKALAALQRVAEILELPAEPVGQAADGQAVVTETGALPVAFESVTFGYGSAGDGRTILRDVSFVIPAGSRTAIVGPSGAGKSTVLALIERFYPAGSGSVRVGGADVQSIPLAELRGLVSYVEQETPVLAGTIEENIRYAHPEASDAEVREAVERARLADLLGRLSAGLDTSVGDAGVLMSGGERQRIAIARALVGNPQVLLLDEATSQLDAKNELAMRETIRAVAGPGSTVITVAHRLSTVVDADQILVLDQGQVVGSGRHADLLRTSPVYRELVQGQLLATAQEDELADPAGALADAEYEVVAAADENTARQLGW
jgi:ABC-type multidrug transport system fused ATPase/permease subunit